MSLTDPLLPQLCGMAYLDDVPPQGGGTTYWAGAPPARARCHPRILCHGEPCAVIFHAAIAQKLQGWPKIWANVRPFIGIRSQNLGPTCNFWANPVTVTPMLGRARRRVAPAALPRVRGGVQLHAERGLRRAAPPGEGGLRAGAPAPSLLQACSKPHSCDHTPRSTLCGRGESSKSPLESLFEKISSAQPHSTSRGGRRQTR